MILFRIRLYSSVITGTISGKRLLFFPRLSKTDKMLKIWFLLWSFVYQAILMLMRSPSPPVRNVVARDLIGQGVQGSAGDQKHIVHIRVVIDRFHEIILMADGDGI